MLVYALFATLAAYPFFAASITDFLLVFTACATLARGEGSISSLITSFPDKRFFILSLLLATIVVLSCILNAIPWDDAAKGVLRYLSIPLYSYGTFVYMVRNQKASKYIPLSVMLALGITPLVAAPSVRGSLEDPEYLLKFGLAPAVFLAIVWIISRLQGHKTWTNLIPVASATIGAASIVLGVRSQGVIMLAILPTLWYALRKRIPFMTLALILVLYLIGAQGLATVASIGVSHTNENKTNKEEVARQAVRGYGQIGEFLAPILGSRPEVMLSLPAITRSPLIGVGPNYRDAGLMYEFFVTSGNSRELSLTAVTMDEKGKPPVVQYHSTVLGAFAEIGIFGMIYMMYCLWLTWHLAIKSSITQMNPLFVACFCYLYADFLWSALFSPFGGLKRILIGLTIGLSAYAWRERLRFLALTSRGRLCRES